MFRIHQIFIILPSTTGRLDPLMVLPESVLSRSMTSPNKHHLMALYNVVLPLPFFRQRMQRLSDCSISDIDDMSTPIWTKVFDHKINKFHHEFSLTNLRISFSISDWACTLYLLGQICICQEFGKYQTVETCLCRVAYQPLQRHRQVDWILSCRVVSIDV